MKGNFTNEETVCVPVFAPQQVLWNILDNFFSLNPSVQLCNAFSVYYINLWQAEFHSDFSQILDLFLNLHTAKFYVLTNSETQKSIMLVPYAMFHYP